MRVVGRIASFINDHFFACVVAAALAGLLLPGAAGLRSMVSPILFVMIFGMGLTLTLGEFASVFKRPVRVLAVLLVQYSVLPVTAWLLTRFVADPDLRMGFLIVAVAPSEITSALMVFLAGSDAALGTGAMSLSVLVAPLAMPALLGALGGQSIHLNVGSMFLNLAVVVAVPVLVGAALRTRFARLQAYADECSTVASVMVLLLILVAAANARTQLNVGIISVAALLLAFNLIGYVAGWLTGRVVTRNGDVRPYVFTIGMKEFGVAMAVALAFFPTKASLPATLYGVIMLVTAPFLVKRLRREGSAHASTDEKSPTSVTVVAADTPAAPV
jgi:bile acid:Na+ symporter, BASS family